MSPTELAAIAARAEAASPGPWGVWENHAEIWAGVKEQSEGMIRGKGPLANFTNHDGEEDDQAIADAEFAAHAREDVPSLLKEVERLRKIEKLAEALVDDICEFGTDTPHAWSERFDMLANELVPE